MCKSAAGRAALYDSDEEHNHSSAIVPFNIVASIRGTVAAALTEFASDLNTGATCLKPSRKTIEAAVASRLFVLS